MRPPTTNPDSAPPPRCVGDLLVAAARGEERAWVVLVERFSETIRAVARSYRLSAHDVDEVIQTTWLALIENTEQIRNPEALGAWLAVTARRECLRLIRMSAREYATDPAELPEHVTTGSISARLIQREREEIVRRATERLPPRQAGVLRALYSDCPPSYEELSAALQMPIGSIGPTRGRALASLRRDSNLIAVIFD